jgi:hypothetical protein
MSDSPKAAASNIADLAKETLDHQTNVPFMGNGAIIARAQNGKVDLDCASLESLVDTALWDNAFSYDLYMLSVLAYTQRVGVAPYLAVFHIVSLDLTIQTAPPKYNVPVARGPYLNNLVVSATPTPGSPSAIFLDVAQNVPSTTSASRTSTNEQNISLGTSVGFFGAEPTATLSGGYSYSQSTAITEPDVVVADSSRSPAALWTLAPPGLQKKTTPLGWLNEKKFAFAGLAPAALTAAERIFNFGVGGVSLDELQANAQSANYKQGFSWMWSYPKAEFGGSFPFSISIKPTYAFRALDPHGSDWNYDISAEHTFKYAWKPPGPPHDPPKMFQG